MLKLTRKQKQILDSLLTANPKAVAVKLNVKIKTVYDTKYYLKRRVQNAEEFLAVAKGKYGDLLKRRLSTPSIMPEKDEDEELLFRQHNPR